MEKSPTTGEISAALSRAQKKIKTIRNTEKVDFTHNGKRTHYTYADLSVFVEAIREPMADEGIAILQDAILDPVNGIGVSTLLAHASGEWIQSGYFYLKPGDSKPQTFGSCITYNRRYSLAACLCLVSSADDDDARAAQAAASRVFLGTVDDLKLLSPIFNKHEFHASERPKLIEWMISVKHPMDDESLNRTVSEAHKRIISKGVTTNVVL